MVCTDTQLQLQPATAPNNTHPVLSGKVGCVSTKHGQETLATWQRARCWRPIPHRFCFSKQHCSETAQFISIFSIFQPKEKPWKRLLSCSEPSCGLSPTSKLGAHATHAVRGGNKLTTGDHLKVSLCGSNLVSVYFMTLSHYLQCAIRVTTLVPNFLQYSGESTNCKSQAVSNPNQLCRRSPSLCAFAHLNGHAIWWDTDPNGLGAASWVLTWRSEKSWRDCAPGPIHLRSWHCYLDQQSKVQHPLGQDSP